MSIWLWTVPNEYPIIEVFISNALCIQIKCNNLFWCKELEKSSLKVVVIRVKTKMCAFIMVYSGFTLQVCWQLSDVTHFWCFTITVFLLHYFNVQIEWLTAGDCIAGMHEVVVTERTIDAIKLATQQNRSLWRVSSTVSESNPYIQHHPRPYSWTWYLQSELIVKAPLCFICLLCHIQLFAHIASDAVLKPLGHFAESPLAARYPSMCAGEFVEQELAIINLKGNKAEP